MSEPTPLTIRELERKAYDLRQDLIKMLLEAGSGHSAGPLDLAEFFTAMYFHVLRHDPQNPAWPERDRLCLSCGHVCPIRYTAMIHAGYLPMEALHTLRKFGSPLQGHPGYREWPALEHSSGPLGQGLSVAVGMAMAGRLNREKHWVYCLTSDGEQNEGQVWEAAMFASNKRLHNLICFIDRNNIQIDGLTEDVMPLEPLRKKWEAFNWHVQEIDGHNIEQMIDAINTAKAVIEKPSMIIMHTIAGKGVPFMEYDYTWHGKPPKPEEAERALKALRTLQGKIIGEHE
ncbi:MAG: transketolase [Parcubacteria group bacterium]|nr:transketolase [Parcubacteria group bacterium]